MAQRAIPVSYLDPRSTIGSVKVVAQEGPPLSVRPWTEADGDNKHIAIEVEDIVKLVELDTEFRDVATAGDEILRLCMHLADARKLTHHLISRLAESGDRVAQGIQEKMNDAMAEVRDKDAGVEKPIALCNLHMCNLSEATFDLRWPQAMYAPANTNPEHLSPTDLRYRDFPLPGLSNKMDMGAVRCNINTTSYKQPVLKIGGAEVMTNISYDIKADQPEIIHLLRIVRKYAKTLGLLIRMQDRHNLLKGIDYKSVLDPFNAPEPLIDRPNTQLMICKVLCLNPENPNQLKFDFDSNVFYVDSSKREDMVSTLFEIASFVYQKYATVRFDDPYNHLKDYNLPNIFGITLDKGKVT